ncbi:phosphate/phosphite/phosphonate ABC transporter substrate-binding protein [Thalassococcus sp. BH17M4-6]|uniref:phosphate/phosphite/phosphonate ABC transporter substrate-binding protein n=1 Tax=Thalassococcus sp. BH17M4-6 TaxID=3413148 RepID=UPI003BF49F63
MYDRPETRAATAAFWQAIRRSLPDRAAPAELGQPDDLMAHWRDPALVFSQTCGLPYRTRLHDRVRLLATPDYGLPGCPPGYYNSVLVMRTDDPRSRDDWPDLTLALNGYDSQSGWAAPFFQASALGLAFGAHLVTGAHRASARAVYDGAADIAAIDAQTWRLMCRWDDWTAGLRVADRTEPTPGLPFITAAARDPARDPDLWQALDDMAPADRATLGLRGVVAIPADRYTSLPVPPKAAERG